MTKRTIEIKRGNKYETTFIQENETEALHSLASDLAAKYIGKASFDSYINSFEYYNCTCNETGRYTAFYIMEE